MTRPQACWSCRRSGHRAAGRFHAGGRGGPSDAYLVQLRAPRCPARRSPCRSSPTRRCASPGTARPSHSSPSPRRTGTPAWCASKPPRHPIEGTHFSVVSHSAVSSLGRRRLFRPHGEGHRRAAGRQRHRHRHHPPERRVHRVAETSSQMGSPWMTATPSPVAPAHLQRDGGGAARLHADRRRVAPDRGVRRHRQRGHSHGLDALLKEPTLVVSVSIEGRKLFRGATQVETAEFASLPGVS